MMLNFKKKKSVLSHFIIENSLYRFIPHFQLGYLFFVVGGVFLFVWLVLVSQFQEWYSVPHVSWHGLYHCPTLTPTAERV